MSKLPSRKQIRRDILRLLRNHGKTNFRPKEIAKRLDYRDNRTYRLFRDVLAEMDEQQMIGRVNGRYTYRPRPTKAEGILRVNPRGFGFVEVEGRDEDLYVRETNMSNALDGDLVEVGLAAPTRGSGRREAEVLRVIERRRTQVVGTFQQLGRFAFVDPDDQRVTQDVYVPREDFNGASDGDKVVVSIDRFDDRKASPEGRVLQVLGRADDPEVRVLAVAMSLDVRSGFSEEVLQEAEAIPEAIPQSEIQRRLDLRDKRIFTIDPADAKDFDDAIHIEELANGNFEVGVHIADVSHYVQAGTALDAEAFERGTSVYLVDRVIPMLPEKLSNGVCSLRPREDKLAYSCIMEISPRGAIKGYKIKETLIHSQHRFTYEEAQDFIDGGYPDHPFAQDVVQAARLARTLTRKRMREGAVDFDLPEIRVILDDDGNPVDIVKKERKEANRLIEEFMLLANRTVARHVGKRRDAPLFVYRVHDTPDAEKIQQLAQYVRVFGYQLNLDNGNVTSQELNKLISHIKGNPEAYVIEDAALRAMSKAKYDHDNIGHYGLGFGYYTHFTSPIRRYPDLIAHRLLKQFAKTKKTTGNEAELDDQCRHCSERERVATEAERESVKLKQVEYIRQHLGDRFVGVVSGVTNFGVFVEMEEVLVEGMVHVRDLDDDYYEYDERSYTLVGVDTGRTFRPGDRVEVQVVSADVETRKVDLLFVD